MGSVSFDMAKWKKKCFFSSLGVFTCVCTQAADDISSFILHSLFLPIDSKSTLSVQKVLQWKGETVMKLTCWEMLLLCSLSGENHQLRSRKSLIAILWNKHGCCRQLSFCYTPNPGNRSPVLGLLPFNKFYWSFTLGLMLPTLDQRGSVTY